MLGTAQRRGTPSFREGDKMQPQRWRACCGPASGSSGGKEGPEPIAALGAVTPARARRLPDRRKVGSTHRKEQRAGRKRSRPRA